MKRFYEVFDQNLAAALLSQHTSFQPTILACRPDPLTVSMLGLKLSCDDSDRTYREYSAPLKIA